MSDAFGWAGFAANGNAPEGIAPEGASHEGLRAVCGSGFSRESYLRKPP